MPRKLIGGLIQCSNPVNDESLPVEKIKQAMFDKHVPLIEEAGKKGVQVLCLQEIFNGPYFCPGQDKRWYDAAESVPGPTTEAVAKLAAKHRMAVVVPVYEKEMAGVLYNGFADVLQKTLRDRAASRWYVLNSTRSDQRAVASDRDGWIIAVERGAQCADAFRIEARDLRTIEPRGEALAHGAVHDGMIQSAA